MTTAAFNPERFVSATEAALYLGISRRFLLSLARKGIAGAYCIGTGDFRKRWVFKLSELVEGIERRYHRAWPPQSAPPAGPAAASEFRLGRAELRGGKQYDRQR